jgi:hypothetical protein
MSLMFPPRPWIALLGAILVLTIQPAVGDPAEAEDVAYRMAKTYIDRSFVIAPTDNFGLIGQGGVVHFLVPVNRGLDYVFLAGTDAMAKDVDIYVYDEVGGLILDDRRVQKNAGVQFRSSYNGTANVYLHMARAEGIASWCVLVGRRGEGKRSLQQGLGAPESSQRPPSTTLPEQATPQLSVSGSVGKLDGVSGVASQAQRFTISGQSLKNIVRLTAPQGFQLSKDGVDYSRSLAVQPSGGELGETTIMVRLDPGADPGDSLGGNISIESQDVPPQTVPVQGAVSPAGP